MITKARFERLTPATVAGRVVATAFSDVATTPLSARLAPCVAFNVLAERVQNLASGRPAGCERWIGPR